MKKKSTLLTFLLLPLFATLLMANNCSYDSLTYMDERGQFVTYCPVGAYPNGICWVECPNQ